MRKLLSVLLVLIPFTLTLQQCPQEAEHKLTLHPPDPEFIVPGGSAPFSCFADTQERVNTFQWYVNGSMLDSSDNFMITDSISGQFSFLNVSDPPFEYNLTSVQCGGETGDGDIFCSDIEMIIILIREYRSLTAVLTKNCESSSILLNWTLPSVESDMDITYCVTVINSTAKSKLHFVPETQATEYEFPQPSDGLCHFTEYIVKTVNTTFLASYSILYRAATTAPVLMNSSIENTSVILAMSSPVCFASLNFTSTDTEDNITTVHIPQANLTIMGNLITFNLCDAAQLTPDCDYNVSVTATNVEGREISYIILTAPVTCRRTENKLTTGQVIGIVFAVLFGGGLLFIAVYSTSGLAIACVCYLKQQHTRSYELRRGAK